MAFVTEIAPPSCTLLWDHTTEHQSIPAIYSSTEPCPTLLDFEILLAPYRFSQLTFNLQTEHLLAPSEVLQKEEQRQIRSNAPPQWLLKLKEIQKVYFKVCQFLPIKDLLELQLLSTKFFSRTKVSLLEWAIQDSNGSPFWATVTNLNSVLRLHSPQYSLLGVNYDEESEHSRDLDRTFLLEDTQLIENNKLKLDRVLRALSKNGLYFQGLNYIASAFLSEHNEQNAYWYTRFLLYKGGYFQNDLQKLDTLIRRLENMMSHCLPRLRYHLENEGHTIDYFATKWFIAMFSYDTPVELMLKLWKLVVLSDENMLLCFTVCLLAEMEEELLGMEEEELNLELKTRLKERVGEMDGSDLLRKSVEMFVREFSELNFGFDKDLMQENGLKNSTTRIC